MQFSKYGLIIVNIVFRDYEDLYYGLTQLHNDCMDLFSYFNAQLVTAMIKCTQSSLECLKNRTKLSK